jgi:diacylglycerol kinase (ATP)
MHPEEIGGGRASTLWRSFGHAWDGLVASARSERNMRIHLVAGILAGSFAALAPLQGGERAIIVLCAALVVAAEAGNTALEALVDLVGGAPSAPARIAKDAAAGAVLTLAAASVAVFGIIVWGSRAELLASWRALVPPALAGLGLAAVGALALSGVRPAAAGVAPVAAAGGLFVVALAGSSSCVACVAIPALLFAVAVDAARPCPTRGPPHVSDGRAPPSRGR